MNLVTTGKIKHAYDTYAGPGFKHHNPFHQGDAVSLMNGMIENDSKFPEKKLSVKHVLEDGDLVAVHSHVVLKRGELELATLHLFKFENGKIAEFWDVGQIIPQDNPNKNGMF